MATSAYFTHGTSVVEQTLLNNMVVESIQIMGFDVNYLPRTRNNIDTLFEDAERNSFTTQYTIEMYLDENTLVSGFGNNDTVTRFGFEVPDTAQFTVAQSRFTDVVTAGDATILLPREGDLIYLPMSKQIYEIMFVEDMVPFFQIGKNYVYRLDSQLFQYADEELATGITDIDSVETTLSYHIDLTMNAGGSGAFTVGSTVYQGSTLATSAARGEVVSWNSSTRVLRVMNIDGSFAASTAVTDGTASWVLTSYDAMTMAGDGFSQNLEIETDADSGIVDFSETNPFGNF
tara:strand:+ start:26 stop:892 length:867 start_codon:yes stop_codon:yes gene_type:complete